MPQTILIVDDSSTLRQLLNMSLRAAGYEVIEACDGEQGLGLLDGRKVHLIISDLNMPRLDGLSFVRAIKQLPLYKFTPIVMLTTELSQARKDEGRDAGLKAWVIKPFKPQQMLDVVQKLVMP